MVSFRAAAPGDVEAVSSVLLEAAAWLRSSGMPMWSDERLTPGHIRPGITEFIIAESDGEIAGVMRHQLVDPDIWPDVAHDDSVFVHRLAVRRRFAGGVVSSALLDWAVERTRELGRRYVRLDCDATRPRLRAVYERHGFRHHSDVALRDFVLARYELLVLPAPSAVR